jgi:hypothetical protein
VLCDFSELWYNALAQHLGEPGFPNDLCPGDSAPRLV